jgi:hypothetical protein
MSLDSLDCDRKFIGRLLYVLPLTQFDAFAFAAAIPAWKLQNLRHSSRLIIAVGLITIFLGAAIASTFRSPVSF